MDRLAQVTLSPSAPLNLDEEQTRVVDHEAGSLLVLGGPGTGKTTVLSERFCRLSKLTDCSPDRILFLVPNRAQKMALQQELATRLLLHEGLGAIVEVPVYTWHGFAYHLVTRHYRALGYAEPPVLLTSPEQWGDIKEALEKEQDIDWPQYKHLLRSHGFVDEVVDFCIRAQQRLMEEEELDRIVKRRSEFAEIVSFFRKHRRRLKSSSRVDYPTLLEDATALIANDEEIRRAIHKRFLHVLVDDAQELALVQQRFLYFLSEGDARGRSLTVAADPDSAIEAFRGAEPDWLQGFEKEFGSHEQIRLQNSYRLGDEIGSVVTEFISESGEAEHRARSFLGETALEVLRFSNLSQELEAVARRLRQAHLRDGVPYEEMAVLVTTPSSILSPLERALRNVEVPYSVTVPDRSLEREPAVASLCGLARFALFGETESLDDLLRSPIVGLEDHQVRELHRVAHFSGMDLATFITEKADIADQETRARLRHLGELKDLFQSKASESPDAALFAVLEASDWYRSMVERARGDVNDPANRQLDALLSFHRSVGRFVERRRGAATLEEYLGAISRADFGADPWLPPERSRAGVQIRSFHAAKGKQWSVVAVVGCVEGAIPKGRRARGLFDPYFLEEESEVQRVRNNEAEDRRVFYVAITRASKLCIVTTSPGPSRRGRPSRFVEELAGEDLEVEAPDSKLALTLSEAAARFRRTISDPEAQAAERVAALAGIKRISEVEPNCTSAVPQEWWWRWDWTEGAAPIRDQGSRNQGLPEGKMKTSYSRISQYDNCGLAYLFSVVMGLDPETSHNMAFGTWIHQIFEDCEKDPSSEQKTRQGRRRITSLEKALERYEELFDATIFPNRAVARQFHKDGRSMIERYVKFLRPGRAVEVEHEFDIDLDGHRITGRIDRIDRRGNGIVVSDYKTSRYPIAWGEAQDSLQLAIYHLASKKDEILAAHGEPISMQLIYPGLMSGGEVTIRAQNPEQAVKVLERLPQLIEGVVREDFRPSPEADCKWCKFKHLCPLWPEGRELQA